MVDKTFVLRKIAALDEYLGQIREYERITVDAYRNDWKTQWPGAGAPYPLLPNRSHGPGFGCFHESGSVIGILMEL